MLSFRLLVMTASLCLCTVQLYAEAGRLPVLRRTPTRQNLPTISPRPDEGMTVEDDSALQESQARLELRNSESPVALVIDLVKRKRRSVFGRECRQGTRVTHRQERTGSYSIRLKGDHALYLTYITATSSFSVSRLTGSNNARCFRFHYFTSRILCQSSGDLVMLETQGRRNFFSPTVDNGITVSSGLSASSTTHIDSRFFRIYREPGEFHDRIKHLASGSFLSATVDRVVLANATSNVFPDDMLFQKFPCTS
ncbi:uncharacterized protein LOC135198121 [Macrobrachium nipponense]|uniref:uncharacterized protein LOC135198121 n=1 Tax=Macrobrachium nipponense TaxID=159736 RepID=UPI0030C865BB